MKSQWTRIVTLTSMALCLALSSAHAESFVTLKQKIQEQRVDSIDKLLPLLSEPLRSKYALMFHSRSLQSASFENPRVITYEEGGKFLLAFNGDPLQRGFYDLEVAEFDDEQKQFNLYEINFPAPGQSSKTVRFSEVNPKSCTHCHGTPARPIWDTHPIWPGSYGQAYHAPLNKEESEGLARFLKAQPENPRYAALMNVESFAKPETFAPNALSRYEGRDKYLPPSAALGQILNDINVKMIAQEVVSAPNFSHLQYALLAALIPDCKNLETFVPPEQREATARALEQFISETAVQNKMAMELKKARFKGAARSDIESKNLSEFRFFAEHGLELKTDNWTTALEKQTYDFTAPAAIDKSLSRLLLPIAIKNDPSLAHLVSLRSVSAEDHYCTELGRKSRSAGFQLRLPVDGTMVHLEPMPILHKCLGCHQGNVASKLPFDDSSQLAQALDQGHYPRGTLRHEILFRLSLDAGDDYMPRGHMIGAEERQTLINFLTNLSSDHHANQP